MNLLITGATGFVGKNIIPQIYKDITKNIAIIVRDEEKAKQIFRDYKNINIISQKDNEYKIKIKSFNPHIVINLASYLTDKRDQEAIDSLINANIRFGTHLLDALDKTNIRYFINIGTSLEYLNNDKILESANLYSATKTGFREIIKYYQSILKFKWINIIPYSIYGGEDTQKKVIDLIIESLVAQDPIKMTKGEQELDFIHIKDIKEFFISLLNNINLIEEDFIEFYLGTGIGTNIIQVSNLVETIFRKKCNIQWNAIPYREKNIMKSVADITSCNCIKWKPKINLYQGIVCLKNQIAEKGE